MRIGIALAALAAGLQLGAQDRPTIVTTDWLAQYLNDSNVVVLHMVRDSTDYRMGHIPGAREVQYSSIITTRDSIGAELPPADELRRVFERLGVSDNSHVVIYSGMTGTAPAASRAFLSLDYLGHRKVSLLSGGIVRWKAEKRPVSTDAVTPTPGHMSSPPRDVVVDANWVLARTGKKGFAFIDTRPDPEYQGTSTSPRLPSDGHITGARQLQWEQLFANSDSALFLDPAAIAKLFADRSAPGDTLVTYCLVGYRGSMTYFGARLAGLPVKLYDGSYQDWSRRKLPVVKGASP